VTAGSFDVLLEEGTKRTFVSAADWPGWSRPGRDAASALETLAGYGARYAAVLEGSEVPFAFPATADALHVAERTEGNATTDFGAPDGTFEDDGRAIDAAEWGRLQTILEACWGTFDRTVDAARGAELRKGPRGGGRDLDAIVGHVVQAEVAYLRKLTGAGVRLDDDDPWRSRLLERDAVREGILRAAADDLPATGPRGGTIWAPRRFLRRTAWHLLDHAWEIGDRVTR
jgi:hypothetical protein